MVISSGKNVTSPVISAQKEIWTASLKNRKSLESAEYRQNRRAGDRPYAVFIYDALQYIIFKESLADITNRDFLEYLLELFLDLQKKSLHNKLDVKYESIIKPKRYNEKMTRVDLLVEYDDTIVNIEMYRKLNNESITKSNHYIMKTFSNIDQSERYRNSKK